MDPGVGPLSLAQMKSTTLATTQNGRLIQKIQRQRSDVFRVSAMTGPVKAPKAHLSMR